MCLGIPGQVVELLEGYGGQLALVDVAGVQRKINIGLLDEGPLEPGTWVLIHMGFALERVDAAGADQAMGGLELMGRPRDFDADDVGVSSTRRGEDVVKTEGEEAGR